MFQTDNIAILMATYQGEHYIREQIDSIIIQNYDRWELYIHDDGSHDGTMSILEEYVKQYPHKIHLLEGPATGGAKTNFMYLLNSVAAPYLMFCDQDDVWLNDKIESTFLAMKKAEKEYGKEKPLLVFSDLKVVDQHLKMISEKMSSYQQLNPEKIKFRDLMIQNVITGCTTMINHPLQQLANSCVDMDNMIMHDWWCALVAAYFGSITFVNSSLILYRQHGNNSVGAKKIANLEYILSKISKPHVLIQSLVETQAQIALFLKTYSLQDSLLIKYSKLSTHSKFYRLAFYIKHGIWKSGFMRNVGLIVWG